YEDYRGLDVAGKVVLILRKPPRWENEHAPFDGDRQQEHAGLEMKLATAELHSAAAVVLVNDRSESADELVPFDDTAASPAAGTVPFLQVRRGVADAMLRSGLGVGLRELEQDIDRDLKPRGGLL